MNFVARKVRGRDFAELPWTDLPGIDFPEDPGEEPWWVVVAEMAEDEFASTTADAPSADEAEAHGQRVITGREGRVPARIARVTGPFPKHVPTEERERRPGGCQGCGLERFCGNHPPTPVQTWFVEGPSSEEDIAWQCINCGTRTWMPKTWLVTDGGDATTAREVPLSSVAGSRERCSVCPPIALADGGTRDAGRARNILWDLSSETIDWMAEDPTREDVADEVWAVSLATFVDGTPITPNGYDVSDKFGPRYCSWCYSELTDEPAGSTLCRDCFFGPPPEYIPLLQRVRARISHYLHTESEDDLATDGGRDLSVAARKLESEHAPDCSDCGARRHLRGIQRNGADTGYLIQWECPECEPQRVKITSGLPDGFDVVERDDRQQTLTQASTDGGVDQPPTHSELEPLSLHQTVRVTVDDRVVIGEVDATGHTGDGQVTGHSVTVIEQGHRGAILDVEATFDPREGWSDLQAVERLYTGDPPTEFVELGAAEIEPIDLGVDPDDLDPGRVVELWDGDEYRVVIPPWEREYDSKALVFNLESTSNVLEKAKPSEVVRLVR